MVGARASELAPPTRPQSAPLAAGRADQIETIPMGERWLADGFRVVPSPGAFAQRAVDMTKATEVLGALANAGHNGTFTHVLIRAAALALARNPRLHQSAIGYRKFTPGSVDIGLSMVGQTTYAPVVVLADADRTPLRALVGVVESATAAARLREARDLKDMRRLGWMTPFGAFRRFVIRMLQKSFRFRRHLVGTFQITCVPTVDSAVPLQFYSGSILSFGRVRSTVVAVDGRVEVRPMLTLTICVDHATTDATRAAALLNGIALVLESDELVDEAREAVSDRPPPLGPGAPLWSAALPPSTSSEAL